MARYSTLLALIFVFDLLSAITAYRPTQFCKHSDGNGHYDACFSVTQTYNTTNSVADLSIRFASYRYESSSTGWHAMGLGDRMDGALMFVLYGDPASDDLTITSRTSKGHHPPHVLDVVDKSIYTGAIPNVEIVSTHWERYTGPLYSNGVQPSHVGVADIIVRSFGIWRGTDETSTTQPFIWASNFEQDFQGDYSQDRSLEKHRTRSAHGYLWVDLLWAETPTQMFGEIVPEHGLKGTNEIPRIAPPSSSELAAGKKYINSKSSGATPPYQNTDTNVEIQPPPIDIPLTTPPQGMTSPPVHKIVDYRNLLWHIHGILMMTAFLFFYPLGIYLLRSSSSKGFNSHWILQTLGSVFTLVGAVIGYFNSHGISITHQYWGIFMAVALVTQGFLGFKHHVLYLKLKRSTWIGKTHRYFGRFIVPLGATNIMTGLMLRGYSQLTIGFIGGIMLLEVAFLFLVIQFGMFRSMNLALPRSLNGESAPIVGVGLETNLTDDEYFQVAGDDEEDESDDETRVLGPYSGKEED